MQGPGTGTAYEPLLRALDEAADAVSLLGPDGSRLFASASWCASWCELTGYELDDVLSAPIRELVHPGDRDRAMDMMARRVDTPMRLRVLGKRRRVVPVMASPSPLYDPAGNYLGTMTITRRSGPRRFVAEEAAALKRHAGSIGAALVRAHADPTATEATPARVDDPLAGLTPREREIALLLAEAAVPKEIAFDLDISLNTARNHIQAIYRKLGIHARQELMLLCLRNGA